MLTLEQLKRAVHKKGITKTDIALLCLAGAGGKGVAAAQVKKTALSAGVKGAKNIYYSQHLTSAEDKCCKTPDGWELLEEGRKYVASIAAIELSVSPAATQAQSLRALIPTLKTEDAKVFVLEAIVCAEQSLVRAAVVLSWVGAMSLLYDHVVTKHLAAFNALAASDPKWKPAKNADDLGAMNERTFLDTIHKMSIIGKNVKQQLITGLELRNGCGHPNSLKVGPNMVASHLEMLVKNIYSQF